MTVPDKVQRDKATILAIIKYALIAAVAAGVIYYGFRLILILMPFVIGFVLARAASLLARKWLALIRHIRDRVQQIRLKAGKGSPVKRLPSTRGLAKSRAEIRLAVVIYVFLVIAVTGLLVGVVIGGFNQLRSLAEFLPGFVAQADLSNLVDQLVVRLSEIFGGYLEINFLDTINEWLVNFQLELRNAVPGLVTKILNGLAAFAGYLPTLFLIIIVVIMSGYYFIADSRRLFRFIRRNITSSGFRQKTLRLVNSLSSTLFRVIGGYIFLLSLTFAQALLGLSIIGMPYAVIFALFASILDFLPVVGIGALLVPISVYLFINGNVLGGIGALILLTVMTLVRRIVEPAILGNAMRLHPLATLASMIIGIAIYGISGLILGPIILVIAKEVMKYYGFDQKFRILIGEILNKVSS